MKNVKFRIAFQNNRPGRVFVGQVNREQALQEMRAAEPFTRRRSSADRDEHDDLMDVFLAGASRGR